MERVNISPQRSVNVISLFFFRFHSRINYSEPLVVDTESPGNECGALRLEGFGLYPNAKIGKNRVSGNSGS